MAIKIEINKKLLENLIDMGVASCRRGINTSKRPEFEEVFKKEIDTLFAAKASITEITK